MAKTKTKSNAKIALCGWAPTYADTTIYPYTRIARMGHSRHRFTIIHVIVKSKKGWIWICACIHMFWELEYENFALLERNKVLLQCATLMHRPKLLVLFISFGTLLGKCIVCVFIFIVQYFQFTYFHRWMIEYFRFGIMIVVEWTRTIRNVFGKGEKV